MLSISTRAYCAYDAVVGRHCRVSRRPLHLFPHDRHMDLRPFSCPSTSLGDPCHKRAWRRNTPFVGSLLVKLHATHTVKPVP